MKKPVPLPPIAQQFGISRPASSNVAMYAPHTRTTDGFAVSAIFCCCGGSAYAVAAVTISNAHATRMTSPIEPPSYRILGSVGFGILRHARSRKGRGLFRKAPDPREVGDRLA